MSVITAILAQKKLPSENGVFERPIFSYSGGQKLGKRGKPGGGVLLYIRMLGVDSDTGGKMTRLDLDELRRDALTGVNRVLASRVKMTSGWRIYRRGNIAPENYPFAFCLDFRVGNRNGRDQSLGIWHQWIAVNFPAVRKLDDASEIHYGNAVREMAYCTQVMRNKEIRQIFLGL